MQNAAASAESGERGLSRQLINEFEMSRLHRQYKQRRLYKIYAHVPAWNGTELDRHSRSWYEKMREKPGERDSRADRPLTRSRRRLFRECK